MGDEITLTEEELKQQIEEAVEEKTAGLKKNRDELLEEKKEWQAKAKEREEKYNNLESQVQELRQEKAAKEGDIDEVRRQIAEQKEKEIEQIQSEKQNLQQTLENRLIESELTDALINENIAKPYLEPLKASLRGAMKVKDNNGDYRVIADSEGMDKDVKEYVAEKVEELGREYFMAASENSGGGAGSSGAGNGTSKDNPLDRASEGFTLTGAMQFVKENGPDSEKVKQLLSAAEKPVNV